jgi:hypothetical protein
MVVLGQLLKDRPSEADHQNSFGSRATAWDVVCCLPNGVVGREMTLAVCFWHVTSFLGGMKKLCVISAIALIEAGLVRD